MAGLQLNYYGASDLRRFDTLAEKPAGHFCSYRVGLGWICLRSDPYLMATWQNGQDIAGSAIALA